MHDYMVYNEPAITQRCYLVTSLPGIRATSSMFAVEKNTGKLTNHLANICKKNVKKTKTRFNRTRLSWLKKLILTIM